MTFAGEVRERVVSPDRHIVVEFSLAADGAPRYSVSRDGRDALLGSQLGLVRDDADLSTGLELIKATAAEIVDDRYELLTSKRRLNHYTAEKRVFELQNARGERLDIEFRVSNDGIAFRYRFPETDAAAHTIEREATSYVLPEESLAWLQPMSVAKSGWQSSNPSYEEVHEQAIPLGTPPSTGSGWVYPALFHTGSDWVLVSETGLVRNYCATRLQSTWRSAEYRVAFPGPLENFQGGAVRPEGPLPWTTPWRIVVIGDLAAIVESTLGTDLAAQPAADANVPAEGPGKASWSWPLLGDGETVFATQKRFIDYAADMGWEYTLVDSMWDQQIGYDGLQELVTYAAGRGVRILAWYNSAGDWNSTPQTPRGRMLTHESRVQEFERLQRIGVAGLKVDFFGGDGQSVIGYYQDILEDAARYGFVMNFHGATLPRGWQRTYPNLMTMEAVRGLEFVTFQQRNADDEPTHAAMLPFTRNVFDPMDFTPVVLDRIRNIERRTSSAFELATAVLFTSGIQHYAEIPEGMAKAPAYVRDFLRDVPVTWDDVRYIDGYPGRYVVLARRAGERWYLAGINAGGEPREVDIDLAALQATRADMITDGDGGNLSFRQDRIAPRNGRHATVTIAPRGGFVAITD